MVSHTRRDARSLVDAGGTVNEDSHEGLKRTLSDESLRTTFTIDELYDMASACDVEPADPTVCDSCAAYLIAQELEDAQ